MIVVVRNTDVYAHRVTAITLIHTRTKTIYKQTITYAAQGVCFYVTYDQSNYGSLDEVPHI